MIAPLKSISYGKQQITEADLDAVKQVLLSDYLTQGSTIDAFEEAFAAYVGSKFAVALSNGTAALHLCAMALGVGAGSRVIVPSITFAASANCIRYCDGDVYFCDIHPHTYTADYHKIEELITSKPKGFFSGMVLVDFAGFAVNLEQFRILADRHGIWIIEDACHAPGGYFIDGAGHKQLCGNGKFADLAIFSFHPVKHLTTGEGGMITTNNRELYQQLRMLRTHGITREPDRLTENHGGWYYEMQTLGYNYRLTDFQAALGISQLKRADAGVERRRELAARYTRAFENKAWNLGNSGIMEGHAYHLYILQSPKRKELYDFLRTKQIYAQVHYIPVHTMPYYKQFESTPATLEEAEKYYQTCLSLPMYPTLSNEEQDFVIEQIFQFYEQFE
jgi:UDP-4-amino-4,6-dideoxy-N-acetyl-beta-L-altrosamine transaminase